MSAGTLSWHALLSLNLQVRSSSANGLQLPRNGSFTWGSGDELMAISSTQCILQGAHLQRQTMTGVPTSSMGAIRLDLM